MIPDPFVMYTGQMYLPEIELYHYRARMYDPEMGRFLQTDPVGYEDQMNLYAYVGNDPMNLVDPTGKCQQDSNGNYVGVCGSSKEAAQLVSGMLKDSNSGLSDVESAAASQGKMVEVATGSTAVSGEQVNGAKTETITYKDGSKDFVVTIDTSETVTMTGVNPDSGEKITGYEASDQEVLEHELVGHVMDGLKGVDRGRRRDEQNAMGIGNSYREKHGIKFRRTKYEIGLKRR